MDTIKQAFLYSIFSKYLNKLLILFSIIIVSRLLSPEELGVFSIASAIVAVTGELKSFGIAGYIVRKKVLDKSTIQSALGLTILVTWSLGTGLIITASPLKEFYEIDDLDSLIYLLSFSFYTAPFIAIPQTILSRNLRFKEIFISNISSQVISIVCIFIFIYAGYSYFSLAIASIIASITQLLVVIYLTYHIMHWIPKFSNMKKIARFGIFITMANLFRRLSFSTPELIIGKFNPPTDVAIFSRATGLMDFLSSSILEGVMPVAAPYLASQQRQSKDLTTSYIKATLLTGSILWPVLTVAGLASEPIIMLLFGAQWISAAPIASTLTLWAIFRSVHSFSPALLMTIGHEKTLFLKEFLIFLLTALAVYLAIPLGLEGIAWAIVFSSFMDFIATSLLLYRIIGLSFKRFIHTQKINLILVAASFTSTKSLDYFIDFGSSNHYIVIISIVLLNSIVWLPLVYLLNHPVFNEISIIFKKIFHRSKLLKVRK